jgi:phage terminase small subunit
VRTLARGLGASIKIPRNIRRKLKRAWGANPLRPKLERGLKAKKKLVIGERPEKAPHLNHAGLFHFRMRDIVFAFLIFRDRRSQMTPEQKLLFDELTELQQRTATGVLAGMTQRQAYYQAGGKAKDDPGADMSACQIIGNPKVKAFMDSMKVQAVSDAIMTREEAMKILTALGRGNLTDIVKFKTSHVGQNAETGDDIHQTTWLIDEDLQANDPEKLMIISELEVGKNGPKIKQHSKVAAIAQLAKMGGWEAAQKFEHAGPGGGPILTKDVSELSDEQLQAIIAGSAASDE